MSKRSEAVKRWRNKTKERMTESMGGECVCCGYKVCQRSLDFHHLDPSEKELSFGKMRAEPHAWSKIVEELRKCVLVCSNCHGEIHEGLIEVPKDAARFNEEFAEYSTKSVEEIEPCPICGEDKPKRKITCSRVCAARKTGKVNWSQIDLEEKLKTQSISRIAEELDVSWNAVKKRMKKVGIP